jgi:hypothetical protein
MTTTVVPLATVTVRVALTEDEVERRMQHPGDSIREIIAEHVIPPLIAHGVPGPIDTGKVVAGSSILAWNDPVRGDRILDITFPHPTTTAHSANEANPLHGLHIRIEDGPLAGHTTNIALADPDCIEIDYHPGSEPMANLVLTGDLSDGQRLRYCRTGYDVATGQWTYELEQETP